ncbi:unnamed protein product [Clonostachys rosea]|uniref:Uncharacterized protein n=1 Tax=Bionectria ochroleuca TaxID=29856 RepID=A0ABY6U454_BIOOC|nr:unnamed protein product [Clonostachys rosea]
MAFSVILNIATTSAGKTLSETRSKASSIKKTGSGIDSLSTDADLIIMTKCRGELSRARGDLGYLSCKTPSTEKLIQPSVSFELLDQGTTGSEAGPITITGEVSKITEASSRDSSSAAKPTVNDTSSKGGRVVEIYLGLASCILAIAFMEVQEESILKQ